MTRTSILLVMIATMTACAGQLDGDQGPEESSQAIINGVTGDIRDLPWQVSLQIANYGHVCGGAILDAGWVVSAAHCFDPAPEAGISLNLDAPAGLYVVAGLTNFADQGGQLLEVERVVVHENYAKGEFGGGHDIALLKLKTAIDLSDPGAGAIQVARPEDEALWAPGTMATASGW